MSEIEKNMSLTPPSRMSALARIGLTAVGLGLLATLVAWAGPARMQNAALIAGGAGLVAGGVLLTKREQLHPIGWGLMGTGLVLFVMTFLDFWLAPWMGFALTLVLLSVGGLAFFIGRYGGQPAGIRNDGTFQSEATRPGGQIAWVVCIVMTGFYVLLYWFPEYLDGLSNTVKPLKKMVTGNEGGAHWFLYSLIYTLAVVVMGIRYILRNRHIKYQTIRTLSVMFFQVVLAFTLPSFFEMMQGKQMEENKAFIEEYNTHFYAWQAAKGEAEHYENKVGDGEDDGLEPETLMVYRDSLSYFSLQQSDHAAYLLAHSEAYIAASPKVASVYFSYFWPLDYDMAFPENIDYYVGPNRTEEGFVEANKAGFGTFGLVFILFGLGMSTIGVVVLTYFFGKRWYCSWVCGCGGLAETAGDPYRHLSDKSLKAWRIERVLIHSVLVLISLLTFALVLNYFTGLLGGAAYPVKAAYGFVIGSIFAGVVGTGFYPLLGNRVWCRFGCPQAAILGILQKYFSRFRITTNGGQCISCGNCSTYCEMGIDVKWYAQRGQNIIRASCVGCGVCSAVCPRGVLNLENGPKDERYNGHNPLVAHELAD